MRIWTRTGRGRCGAVLGLVLATAMLIAACGGSSSNSVASKGSPINVCGDLALSGAYSQLGQTNNWGLQAWVKWVDAHGGLKGHQVHYNVIDNQSQPAQAALVAQKCIKQDHATFVAGPESGADADAAMPIAIASKTIMVTESSGWATNGYKNLTSYGFPGFYDVFYNDQLASVQTVIVPQHMTRVAVIQNQCGPVCTVNQQTVQQLAAKYHFNLVATQTVPLTATNITPQVLSLLQAKPQIILLGLVPGPPSITAIRAIRDQDPNIPISECSACELPSFISAAGGATNMQHVYVLGSMQTWLQHAQQGTSTLDKETAASISLYFQAMKAAGLNSTNQLVNSQVGFDTGLEIGWAVTHAPSLSEDAMYHTLQHLKTNTMGIQWDRTPQNYENISAVDAAMEVIKPNGQAVLYNPPSGG
ncbi:MAG: ABC transporter substrate-binding protein [Solirubrobacteraceae bacterium]